MHVFVSHSTSDRNFVQANLLPFLREHGLDPWYSPRDINTAKDWERSIRQALEACELFLVVLTPASVQSEWVRAEVHWAMQNRSGRTIPVLRASCNSFDLHLKLALIQHVDLRADSPEAWEGLSRARAFAGVPKNNDVANAIPRGRLVDYQERTPKAVRLAVRSRAIGSSGPGIELSTEILSRLISLGTTSPPGSIDELRQLMLRCALDVTPVKVTVEDLTEILRVVSPTLMDRLLDIAIDARVLVWEEGAYSVADDLESELLDAINERPPSRRSFRRDLVRLFCEMCRARLLLHAGTPADFYGLVGGLAFSMWRGSPKVDDVRDILAPKTKSSRRRGGNGNGKGRSERAPT